jgi:O-antigen ligase
MTLTLGLAVICGLGLVVEYRLDLNVFTFVSQHLLPGVFRWVADGNGEGVDSLGRRWIVGPAGFGVEAVGMMAMALPIAVTRLIAARRRSRRLLYAVAIVVLFAGMFATQRKSALVAPVAVIVTLAYFRRRELLSLAPLGLVMGVIVAVVSPGALHGVISQFTRADRSHVATVSDRVSDYDAIRPDLWTHPLLGRGFGSYAPETYRILDSEILGRVVETGVLGLAAFLMLGLTVVVVARRTVAARDPAAAPYALCGIAAAVCFLVLAMLFDELSYPHGTYIFLSIAVVVAPTPGPEPPPPWRRDHARRRHPPRARPDGGHPRRRTIHTR